MHDLQDANLCAPKDRNCVYNEEASETYDCRTSCEGIHSDIQWQNETVGKSRDGGQEMDREAFEELEKEYKEFKRNYSRDFRFEARGDSKLYGKN